MNHQTSDVITNPHDQFFRQAMKDKRVANEFLKIHLPSEICALVDFDALTLQPRSQTNAVRRESIVDVLFKTQIGGKEAYIYLLLEHQSTPDPLMSFRVIQYTINAIDEHLRIYKTTKIPLIYPLVVYHGKPYHFTTNINDLVDAPRELVEKYFLKPFQLLDLNQIEDEMLKQNTWSGIMAFVLKHIFARDMLPFLRDIAPLLKMVDQHNGRDFIGIVLQYILERAELSDEEAFFKLINTNLSHDIGEKIMSLAEKLRLEGELRGKLEGKLEGEYLKSIEIALRMIEAGSDAAFIMKVTKLPLEKIKELQSNDAS